MKINLLFTQYKHEIKSWWNEYGLFDVILIPLCVFCVLSYFSFQSKNQNMTAAIVNLWPNVATDLIGIWLGVRIIDSHIKSRDKHHQIRNRIIDYISSIISLIASIKYMIPEDFSRLIQELKFISDYSSKKKKYFSVIEMENISECIQLGNNLKNLIEEYFLILKPAKNEFSSLKTTFENVKENRKNLNSYIKKCNDLSSEPPLILNELNDFKDLLSLTRQSVTDGEYGLLSSQINTKIRFINDGVGFIQLMYLDYNFMEYLEWYYKNWFYFENNTIGVEIIQNVISTHTSFVQNLENIGMIPVLFESLHHFNETVNRLITLFKEIVEKADLFSKTLQKSQDELIDETDFN